MTTEIVHMMTNNNRRTDVNHQQYLSTLTTDTAGTLARLGCQVVAATAINGQPWVKAKLPAKITPSARLSILAASWQCPATVQWVNV